MQDHICITWCVEDVKNVAPDLTDDQCYEVLKLVESEHNAEIGVNWDTLSYWASEVRQGAKI